MPVKVTIVLLIFLQIMSSVTSTIYPPIYNEKLPTLQKLKNKLLQYPNYMNSQRPVKDPTTPVVVSVIFVLHHISDMDIQKMQLSFSANLYITWMDEYLTWDPKDYEGIAEISVNEYEVWKPKLESLDVNIPSFSYRQAYAGHTDSIDVPNQGDSLRVTNTGQVKHSFIIRSSSFCPVDLTNYPYDTQICNITFGCSNYDSREVQLVADQLFQSHRRTDKIIKPHPTWDVSHEDITVKTAYLGNRQHMTVDTFDVKIRLERRGMIYNYIVSIPYYVSLMLGFLAFFNPIPSLKRLIFSMTSSLVLFCLLLGLLSQVGYNCMSVPKIFVKCSVSFFCVSFLSLFLPIILRSVVLNMCESNIVLSHSITQVTCNEWVARVFFLHSITSQDKNWMMNSPDDMQHEKVTTKDWCQFLQLMDRILLYSFIIITIIIV